MYDRNVDGEVLAFGHMGSLYRDSFVMYDRGTESLWIQATGKCVVGEFEGRQLQVIPSVLTRWQAWKQQHPETKVLDGARAIDFMGRFEGERSPELFGVSVGGGKSPMFYRLTDLMKHRVVYDRLNGRDIAVFFDENSFSVVAWQMSPTASPLRWNGESFMDESGTAFDPMGSKTVDSLGSRVPATMWFIERWEAFYPERRIREL